MSPRGGPCNHPRCHDYDEGCRQLTDEELTASPDDVAYVEKLIAEGYVQISSKYRTVAKLPPATPITDLIKPEALDTLAGRQLANLWTHNEYNWRATRAREDVSGHVQLTLRQFRAFKKIAGPWWRRTYPTTNEDLERDRPWGDLK